MTEKPKPQIFRFDGNAMVPLNVERAREQYAVGETYRLSPHEERTTESHNHQFAFVKTAWENLPPEMGDKFPSPDHLRKWALIKCGYYTEMNVVCDTPEDAVHCSVIARRLDEFAIAVVHERTATIYRAKSQSRKDMDKHEFQKSKQDILDFLANLIGITSAELAGNVGVAA